MGNCRPTVARPMMLTSRIAIAALLLVAVSVWPARAALPEKLQKDIDKAKADYKEASESADKKLLSAFETEIEAVRKSTGLKATAKLEVIEALGVEKDTFEEHRTIPFSFRMRPAALAYLKAMQQAQRPLDAAYEKAIDELIKIKDDAAAAVVQAEKKKVAKSKAVGVWEITGESIGSTAIAWKLALRGLIASTQPVIVPPVPTADTRMSTLPSVSVQISSAVVLE